MNDEQWESTIDRIEQKFRISDRKREERGEGRAWWGSIRSGRSASGARL